MAPILIKTGIGLLLGKNRGPGQSLALIFLIIGVAVGVFAYPTINSIWPISLLVPNHCEAKINALSLGFENQVLKLNAEAAELQREADDAKNQAAIANNQADTERRIRNQTRLEALSQTKTELYCVAPNELILHTQ